MWVCFRDSAFDETSLGARAARDASFGVLDQHVVGFGQEKTMADDAESPDDVITVATSSSAQQVIRDATDLVSTVAPWLQADHDGLTGKVLKQPERDEIDTPVQESLIVELYSK